MADEYIIERYPNAPGPHLVIWRVKQYSKVQEYICAISYERTKQTHEKDAVAIIEGLKLLDKVNEAREIYKLNMSGHNNDSLNPIMEIFAKILS